LILVRLGLVSLGREAARFGVASLVFNWLTMNFLALQSKKVTFLFSINHFSIVLVIRCNTKN
jgi:hypothetical protein